MYRMIGETLNCSEFPYRYALQQTSSTLYVYMYIILLLLSHAIIAARYRMINATHRIYKR